MEDFEKFYLDIKCVSSNFHNEKKKFQQKREFAHS